MKEEAFAQLVESIKQAGEIKQGYASPAVRLNIASHNPQAVQEALAPDKTVALTN
ncbi:MAG: hypothetical protein KDE58_09270 [Caldilineaceae bacterium]|nr:hypothetical protein [Caldilineaceae bacterium]